MWVLHLNVMAGLWVKMADARGIHVMLSNLVTVLFNAELTSSRQNSSSLLIASLCLLFCCYLSVQIQSLPANCLSVPSPSALSDSSLKAVLLWALYSSGRKDNIPRIIQVECFRLSRRGLLKTTNPLRKKLPLARSIQVQCAVASSPVFELRRVGTIFHQPKPWKLFGPIHADKTSSERTAKTKRIWNPSDFSERQVGCADLHSRSPVNHKTKGNHASLRMTFKSGPYWLFAFDSCHTWPIARPRTASYLQRNEMESFSKEASDFHLCATLSELFAFRTEN